MPLDEDVVRVIHFRFDLVFFCFLEGALDGESDGREEGSLDGELDGREEGALVGELDGRESKSYFNPKFQVSCADARE